MKKKNKLLLTAWIVMLVMAINLFPFGIVYAATDYYNTSVLKDFSATIKQGGVTIPDDGTVIITSTEPINVKISFGVPVVGDVPTPLTPIQQGDTVTFRLSNAFKVPTGDRIPLMKGSTLVGHASFFNGTGSDAGFVMTKVEFDGYTPIFDGSEGISGVTCQFEANFEYNNAGQGGSTGDHTVTILNKTYTVNVPAVPIVYDVTKTGSVDLATRSIEWTATIKATQGGAHVSLADYKFFDDLSGVGTYIPGSFIVDNTSILDTAIDTTGNALGYVFPTGATSLKTIKFKTSIPDSKYFATIQQSVTNTAQLRNSVSTVMDTGASTVTFTPTWIEKEGVTSNAYDSSGKYIPTNRTITWTITANQYEQILKNVVITDALPEGLTLQSASWQSWTGSAWNTATAITPVAGEYTIGNINSKILLTIVTNVPDETYTTELKTYKNSANIKWDGVTGSGPGTGDISVGVGYNAITKSGVAYTSNQKVRWTVNVDTKQQSIPNLKVYDLLVYGDQTIDFAVSDGSITLEPSEGSPSLTFINSLTPQKNQKYAGGFTGTAGVGVNSIGIFKNGTRVADLLEITGLSTTTVNTFSFDSQVVNPDIFAGNKTSTVSNTATLFSANAKLNAANANVSYINRMLQKRLLNRSAMSNPAAGVDSLLTSDVSLGFDYQDKSAIFRLSVNADGIDVTNATNAAGDKLGAATLTDTLPAGWEFVDIIAGSKYLVFEGTGQSNGNVDALDITPDVVAGLTADFSGRTATFTFPSLTKPYVILVKARPTTATAAQYFSENQTVTVTNNVALKTTNWSTGVTSSQSVLIDSKILDKTTMHPTAGELRWTVYYKPYNLAQTGYKLEDQLPIGIDLRMDSSGKLILAGNISVNEMTLNADGTYTDGNSVALVLGTNVSYNSTTRVLTFIIPDNAKAYRFSYLTDITGVPGTISNKVSLIGSNTKQEETFFLYDISTQDGSASFQRNGWINITKNNSVGTPLAGAKFTLFAMDGTTVIREGITGADGTLKLKVIPDGSYILRETIAPSGFALEGVDHSLVVTTSGLTVTSSIDGQTGQNANTITVRDFSEGTVGNLKISKAVAGEGADKTKQYVFTVTLTGANGTYNYIGDGLPSGTISSGQTIALAHGQSITIVGIPKTTAYTVTEADYANIGYTTTSTGNTGSIAVDATQTASFVNTYNANDTLAITAHKTLSGRALLTGEFSFSWQQIDPLSGIPIGEMVLAKNATMGDVFFPAMHYTAADDGKDFVYQIKEVNNKVRTIKYDQTVYQVKVHVTDLGDGTLKVDKTIFKVDAEGKLIQVDSILFHNDYDKSLEGFPNNEGTDTGDSQEMSLLGFLALIGLMGMGTSVVARRKRSE